MDYLREYLSSRFKGKHPPNGNYAWEQLLRKLDDLKDRDRTFGKVSFEDSTNVAFSGDVDTVIRLCINTLHDASKNSKPPFAVPPSDSISNCEDAINDLKLFASDHVFKTDFVKGLINTEETIPLLLIWKLHKAAILQISTYVFRKIGEGSENLVSDAVVWLLSNTKESNEFTEVVRDTFSSLLIASQSRPLNLQLAMICASTLKRCTEDIVNLVMYPSLHEECTTSTSPESSIDLFYLTCPYLWSCGAEAMEQFVQAHLLHLLSEQCAPNSEKTLTDAVSVQEKCTLDRKFREEQFLQIVKGLGAEKVINQLSAAVVRPIVNWKIIFMLIATLLSENAECCDVMRNLTDELIQAGLEGGRQVELAAGFLIARQCCTCDSKNFGSYALWFSTNFGVNSATARNTVQFQALLQLLTAIVPVESAENLRVHINKVPQAPPSCHSILHDYTALARTRLADLNESSELTGLFSDSSKDAVPGLDSKQGDIVRVLLHFQNTHEIIKPVLEAAVLRRQYYRNVFLVELLGLPGSAEKVFNPEDFDLNSKTRHEFILALNTTGRIPDKLFKIYLDKRSSQEAELDNNTESTGSKEVVKRSKSQVGRPKKKRGLDLKSKGQARNP